MFPRPDSAGILHRRTVGLDPTARRGYNPGPQSETLQPAGATTPAYNLKDRFSAAVAWAAGFHERHVIIKKGTPEGVPLSYPIR